MLSMLIDIHMLLAPLVLILQMHTDMGDERGIRLRCICLGRAAPRGSRMRGMGRCGKGSESRIARSSLSIARSSVCATSRCLRINITIRQKRETADRSPWPTARRQASEVMGTAGWRLQQLSRRLTLLGNFLCWGTLSRMKLYVLPERGLICSQRLRWSPLLCAAVLCKRITHL